MISIAWASCARVRVAHKLLNEYKSLNDYNLLNEYNLNTFNYGWRNGAKFKTSFFIQNQ